MHWQRVDVLPGGGGVEWQGAMRSGSPVSGQRRAHGRRLAKLAAAAAAAARQLCERTPRSLPPSLRRVAAKRAHARALSLLPPPHLPARLVCPCVAVAPRVCAFTHAHDAHARACVVAAHVHVHARACAAPLRLAAEELEGRHFGEASCRDYRESVLHVLPHVWDRPTDTRLAEAHFVKHRAGRGAAKRELAENALKAQGGRRRR